MGKENKKRFHPTEFGKKQMHVKKQLKTSEMENTGKIPIYELNLKQDISDLILRNSLLFQLRIIKRNYEKKLFCKFSILISFSPE